MSTTLIDISDELYQDLVRDAKASGRTVEEQLDVCVRIGMVVDKNLFHDEKELIRLSKPGDLIIKIIPKE